MPQRASSRGRLYRRLWYLVCLLVIVSMVLGSFIAAVQISF